MLQRSFGLATDLYELTMAAAYFENGMTGRADFELFVRSLPARRSYLITAGLEQVIDYLTTFRLTSDEVEYVRSHSAFKRVSKEFFDFLSQLRFTGDLWAMPEGTAAFGMEPILGISAPIVEAQVIETFLLSTSNFQTMIASKAARVVTAAQGRDVIDFGARRAHGSEAGLMAARAAYIAGCAGTSNVEAGRLFGIPTFGTLAHSFIMAIEDEIDAFRAFLRVFPETATILVDTYDPILAVQNLVQQIGPGVPAIRLDSGDILELSIKAREILNAAGMNDTRIFASGDLDEGQIANLLERGARIDAFGVGTQMATSHDAAALSGVYKLVSLKTERGTRMTIKLSSEKATYPGIKQVWRAIDDDGRYAGDIIAGFDEPITEAMTARSQDMMPLLEPVIMGGRRATDSTTSHDALERARSRASAELARLPSRLLELEPPAEPYQVVFSQRLEALRAELALNATQ